MSQHLADALELGSQTFIAVVDDFVQDAGVSSGTTTTTHRGGKAYVGGADHARHLVSAADDPEEDEDHDGRGRRRRGRRVVCCGRATRMGLAQLVTAAIVLAVLAALVVLVGISSATLDEVKALPASSTATAYPALGLQGFESLSWSDTLRAAQGESVAFYTYDDRGPYNAWIDSWLAPRLASEYEIALRRVPVSDTTDAVDLIARETELERASHRSSSSETSSLPSNGSVDLLWVNGENFASLKRRGLAYQWAQKTPSAALFDFSSDAIKYDFGLTTNGYEMPYNAAQCVFLYETRHVNRPASDPYDHDYTGSAFVRHVFYAVAAPYTQFLGAFDGEKYLQHAPQFYRTLRELEPFLFDASTRFGADRATRMYPHSQDDVDKLIADGDIWLTLSYDVGHATVMIAQGAWPATINATVLTSGTIANTNFVLIPINAKHKLAAVVAGNLIASAHAMFSRAQPEVIGALQAYNPHSEAFTQGGWNDAFAYIDRAPTTPSLGELAERRLSELNAQYITRIEEDWFVCVLNFVPATAPAYCG